MNVFTVDRRNERLVDAGDDVARQVVGFVLDGLDGGDVLVHAARL